MKPEQIKITKKQAKKVDLNQLTFNFQATVKPTPVSNQPTGVFDYQENKKALLRQIKDKPFIIYEAAHDITITCDRFDKDKDTFYVLKDKATNQVIPNAFNRDGNLIAKYAEDVKNDLMLAPDDRKYELIPKTHHPFFWNDTTNAGYLAYFNDAHADLKYTVKNQPEYFNKMYGTFEHTTNLNSNEGIFENNKLGIGQFSLKDPQSGMYQGILSFSKAFLLKHYILDLDQKINELLLEGLSKYGKVNPSEWVIQSSLHKNTSMFHVHFRLYQKLGANNIRLTNFSSMTLRNVADFVARKLKSFTTNTNNEKHISHNKAHHEEFILQKENVKFASKTANEIKLADSLLDIATVDKQGFIDACYGYFNDLSVIEPIHNAQELSFLKFVDRECTTYYSNYLAQLQIHESQSAQTLAPTMISNLKNIAGDLVRIKKEFKKWWFEGWINIILRRINTLWNEKVVDVCKKYIDEINPDQKWHTLKKADENITFKDLANIPSNYRLRYHKGILYLLSRWINQELMVDDGALKRYITTFFVQNQNIKIDFNDVFINYRNANLKQEEVKTTWNANQEDLTISTDHTPMIDEEIKQNQ